MPTFEQMHSLSRYYGWCDLMKNHFSIQGQQIVTGVGDIELAKLLARAYMSYWYGGLYVVIEGYRRLKLQDPSIDKLLLSRNTMLLKKFRDGVLRHDEEGHRRRN